MAATHEHRFFRKLIGDRREDFLVQSAGISAADGFPPTLETVLALQDVGIDVSSHRSRRLTREMVERADKIFVMEKFQRDMILQMEPRAESKIHILTEYSPAEDERQKKADIPDPIRMSGMFYRNVLEAIQGCVRNIVEGLKK